VALSGFASPDVASGVALVFVISRCGQIATRKREGLLVGEGAFGAKS
jgi:hypothetical protein